MSWAARQRADRVKGGDRGLGWNDDEAKGIGRGWQGNGRGWGGPANGPGWGGPPNGAGIGGPRRTVAEANARKAAIPPQISASRRVRRAEHRDTMLEVYEGIAFDDSQPAMARVAAAGKWLDRAEGKPPTQS